MVTHAGVEGAFPDRDFSNPKMIRKVLNQVEGLTMVAAHMGGVFCWDDVAENLLDTDVYLDASCVLGPIKRNDENQSKVNLMKQEDFLKLLQQFGSERIIFGSDTPWTSQIDSVNAFLSLPITDEDKERILYKNAYRLLGL